MNELIVGPTETAAWYNLLVDAKACCGTVLHEETESYLVFMLQRFVKNPDLADSVLAMDYLVSEQSFGALKKLRLQEVGDKCLLFSGLFPEQAERKCVSVNYFIRLGKSAYGILSELYSHKTMLAALYEELVEEFVSMMKLLHCIREMGHNKLKLSPLAAEELWRTTKSKEALAVLRRVTNGFIV